MIPSVPVPDNSGFRTPIDLKLKPKWRFDVAGGVFESEAGRQFVPHDELPEGTKIAYKVPSMLEADPESLSKHEKDLLRYMHIVLPTDIPPAEYVERIRAWPCTAEATAAPAVSLPGGGLSPR